MSTKSILNFITHSALTRILVGFILIVSVYLCSIPVFENFFLYLGFFPDYTYLISSIISVILVVFSYKVLYKYYEKREVSEFSVNKIGYYLSLGCFIGFLLQSLTILVIYFKGGYEIVSINPASYILLPLAMGLTSSIFEEVLFRGILFRIMEEKLGSYIALIISAFIFGFLHLGNENSSIIMAIGLSIQAGLLLGVSYIYTRSLWFPIAIHFAWNFTQSAIYGANVSGGSLSKTLISSSINGAEWYTGGDFGPEGSIQATIFCLIASIILLSLSIKSKKIIKPFFINQ